jgi:hypothetical protein
MAEFAYNNRIHSATGYSPFFLVNGEHPRMTILERKRERKETPEEFADQMKEMYEEAKAALMRAAEEMAKFYDRRRGGNVEYLKGERVYLNSENLSTLRPMKKLDDKWLGPFKIREVRGPLNVELELPKTIDIYPVFHISLIRKTPDEVEEEERPGPAGEVEGEVAYEVEEILEAKKRYRDLWFRVKWKGYPREEATWERWDRMESAAKAIEKFYKENKDALRVEDVVN